MALNEKYKKGSHLEWKCCVVGAWVPVHAHTAVDGAACHHEPQVAGTRVRGHPRAARQPTLLNGQGQVAHRVNVTLHIDVVIQRHLDENCFFKCHFLVEEKCHKNVYSNPNSVLEKEHNLLDPTVVQDKNYFDFSDEKCYL